jgi:para-aminobenzoate synthetase component 1
MAVGIYDWAVVVDHEARQSWLVTAGRDPLTAADWDGLIALFSEPPPGSRPPVKPSRSPGR